MTEHEGVYTFMGCQYRKETDLGEICTYHNGRIYCSDIRKLGDCFKGYN